MSIRVREASLVAAFCAFLCTPGLTMMARREVLHMYGVAPVKYPPFTASFAWLNEFETFFTAGFGQKEHLIQLHNELGCHVLHDLQGDNVLVGRRGWMFLKQDHGWDAFRSEEAPSAEVEQAWKNTLRDAKAFLSTRKIPFFYVIVPSKETIYPEFLPSGAVRARSTTRLDEMLSILRSADIDVIDLRPELREGKKWAVLYDDIDSHWNGRGAQLGGRRMMSHIADLLRRPQSFADLDSHLEPRESERDLFLILSLQTLESGPSIGLVPDQIHAHKLEAPRSEANRTLFEVPDDSLPKAMILQDSFAEAFMPSVSEKFRRTVWVWTHDLDLRFFGHEKPDVVIVEMTERFFAARPPKLLVDTEKRHRK